ncbi:hypothetical protein DPEC_G00255690 [Dallia pectoralis]|uniref:Uncharacterized protein n=1 Tax=Dallia pectoralis TaxID=75939 RepID=A0ACC2FUM0_DALPE|nr:hypothetical protein DPEC_G00255690 [Dallia pectoralis]
MFHACSAPVSYLQTKYNRLNYRQRTQLSWTMEELLSGKKLVSEEEYLFGLALDPTSYPLQLRRWPTPRLQSQQQFLKNPHNIFGWGPQGAVEEAERGAPL